MPSRPGEEAVSPVIGVILLVAVTVVLSATVFVLAAGMNDDKAEPAPQLLMAADESADEAQVLRADRGLDWFEDLRVAGSCTPLLNGAAFPAAAGTPVQAGDVLSCAPGEDLSISSGEGDGNALLYSKSFS